MHIDLDPVVLRKARKEAEEELREFTEDIDWPEFERKVKLYLEKGYSMSVSEAILRGILLANTAGFEKHFIKIISTRCLKDYAKSFGAYLMEGGCVEAVHKAADMVSRKAGGVV